MSTLQDIAEARAAVAEAEIAHEVNCERAAALEARVSELKAADESEQSVAAADLVDQLLADPGSDIAVAAPQDRAPQIRVAEVAFRQAKAKSDVTDATLQRARSQLEAAEREYAQSHAASLLPAFREAIDQVHAIGTKIVAARIIAREKGERFNPGHRTELGSWYGFESGALYGLARLNWPDQLRPSWAPAYPAHNEHFPHEWPAVKVAAAELRAEIAQ